MSLHFRHYKNKNLLGSRQREFRLGWVIYDRRQPTLDILIGKHVFVAFWVRKNR